MFGCSRALGYQTQPSRGHAAVVQAMDHPPARLQHLLSVISQEATFNASSAQHLPAAERRVCSLPWLLRILWVVPNMPPASCLRAGEGENALSTARPVPDP